jgi:alanyl-tRNA synthetase
VAFRLHDTHGFQLELTGELAAEHGLLIDTERFDELMEQQRRRGRAAAKKGASADDDEAAAAARTGATEFVGYELLSADTTVAALLVDGGQGFAAEGRSVRLILARTPFYAEGGGQVADRGIVRMPSGVVAIEDVKRGPSGAIVHHGRVVAGEVREGEEASAEVDHAWREATARSHTATHIVHWTLRTALGDHARQAGSLVAPGRLRFDFSHHAPVPAEVLEEAEEVANGRLGDDSPVRAYETTQEFARSQGAIALFGERYGEIVRVVEVGDYSRELCGGTHVHHTGQVALIRILGESGIGSGLRRVEALVGPDALRHVNLERRLLLEVVGALGGGDTESAPERVRRAIERVKQLESELGKIRKAQQGGELDRLAGSTIELDGVKLLVDVKGESPAGELRELAIRLRDRLADEPAAVVLVGTGAGRTNVVAALTGPLTRRGIAAADVARPIADAAGGSAGGKPDLAMGGGPRDVDAAGAPAALRERLRELLRMG